jgi:hypothetical protein
MRSRTQGIAGPDSQGLPIEPVTSSVRAIYASEAHRLGSASEVRGAKEKT